MPYLSNEIIWLKHHKDAINIQKLVDDIGIPKSTLYAFINDKRTLNQKWHKPIAAWVKDLIKDV